MGTDIWKGDHLNRQEDAGFLFDYLLQRNEQAVRRGDKGTSINVNAPWGAGKTFFLTRFAKQLRQDGYMVAEVNAWRDDHADDPIFAVMSAILKALGKSGKKAKLREALKNNAGKIAIRSGRGLMKRFAAVFIGQEAVDGIGDDLAKALAEAGEETIGEYADKALDRFDAGQKAIDEFRGELAREVEGQKPLFVLVDELDRCRPTYAVLVLERVKHLFDVPNVIFVFATHADQLTHTIRTVYGTDFDAERYLHRFFDRTYQFDEPSVRQFIEARWEALGFRDERFLSFHGVIHQEYIERISVSKKLSLRDIDQCMDILWSVSEFASARVPVPMLFLYPLVVAYHLRKIEAFEEAAGESGRTGRGGPSAYQQFFDDTVITEQKRFNYDRNRDETIRTTLRDLMDAFRSLLSAGLSEFVSAQHWASEYADRYRNNEFSILHSSRAPNRVKVPSILETYGSLIRRAGRVTPIIEGP